MRVGWFDLVGGFRTRRLLLCYGLFSQVGAGPAGVIAAWFVGLIGDEQFQLLGFLQRDGQRTCTKTVAANLAAGEHLFPVHQDFHLKQAVVGIVRARDSVERQELAIQWEAEV